MAFTHTLSYRIAVFMRSKKRSLDATIKRTEALRIPKWIAADPTFSEISEARRRMLDQIQLLEAQLSDNLIAIKEALDNYNELPFKLDDEAKGKLPTWIRANRKHREKIRAWKGLDSLSRLWHTGNSSGNSHPGEI